ncbi:MAG: HAD-IA family hydrolase [Anaeromyxobacteraceae bacterium]
MSSRAPIAILFDLDGTLVDTIPFILASVRHAFEGYGRCPTDAEWIAGIGTPLRDQLTGFARDPSDVDRLFDRYRAFWVAEHDARTRAFPGAVEVVTGFAAAGHPLGIVTAKLEAGALRTLRHVGLLPHLGAVVGADSAPRAKPFPDPVLVALARLERAPAEAVLVGDSVHDLEAARAAGVFSIAATWGACTRETLATARPDAWADDVRALPDVVARFLGARAGERC